MSNLYLISFYLQPLSQNTGGELLMGSITSFLASEVAFFSTSKWVLVDTPRAYITYRSLRVGFLFIAIELVENSGEFTTIQQRIIYL